MPTAGLPMTWTGALDRFARSVHRFHDRVEVIPDRHLRSELLAVGADLESGLSAVRALARSPLARRGDPAPTVRALMRSGTLCAHATECAVGAAGASRGRDAVELSRCLAEVRAVVAELLAVLDTALEHPRSGAGPQVDP